MRPLAVPLLLLPWALAAQGEPLPGFLDSHEYQRRLPSSNLPLEAYRPVSPNLQVTDPRAGSPAWAPADTRLVLHKVRFEGVRCSP